MEICNHCQKLDYASRVLLGYEGRGRPKTVCMNCVKKDMIKEVIDGMEEQHMPTLRRARAG